MYNIDTTNTQDLVLKGQIDKIYKPQGAGVGERNDIGDSACRKKGNGSILPLTERPKGV
jgi:hypothetical protein